MAGYIQTFLQTIVPEFHRIREMNATQQWNEMKLVVHAVKPQVAFIGLPILYSQLEKIEDTIEKSAFNKMDDLFEELSGLIEEATAGLVQTLITLS
jgi:HPt (histidine-containing phosphotransfer) domain-containing protein